MIGALAQQAAIPASPLGEFTPPDGAGFSLPTGFAELLGKLGLIGRGEKPVMAACPRPNSSRSYRTGSRGEPQYGFCSQDASPGIAKAFVAPVPVEDSAAPVADTEEDDGAVPDGLEEIAETLAQALAAVMAAAGKTVAPRRLRFGHASSAPITLPMATALTLTTPSAPSQATIESATVQDSWPADDEDRQRLRRAVVKLVSMPMRPYPPAELAADPALPALIPAIPSVVRARARHVRWRFRVRAAALGVGDHDRPSSRSCEGRRMARPPRPRHCAHRQSRRAAQVPAQSRASGSLRIELTNAADGTAIRMTADTDAARNIWSTPSHGCWPKLARRG
jgi:hypothetical protein